MSKLACMIASAALVGGVAVVAVPTGAYAGTAAASASNGVSVRVVHGTGTTHLSAGSAGGELAPAVGPEAATVRSRVANRSESARPRAGRTGPGLSGIPAANSAITAAAGATSFSGIDHFQQRYGVAQGNQWSLEPPDQALCVGNGYVFEAVNNAVAVYDTAGNQLAADSLNHFFDYPAEIDRSTGLAGPKQTTDPTCLFDPQTGRFFLTILTYDSDSAGNQVPAGTNTLDTAVSSSSNPLGAWTITHIDATDDGSNGTPQHAGCPCLGDYPHIGVDAHGYYITTNEYPDFTDGFVGAQIYAMSKQQLVSGAESVTVAQVDTSRRAPGGQPGFTVWPAQSPTVGDYSVAAGGTEYFLSTNAAEEANGTGRSNQLLTWSLTNTSSLDSTPKLGVHVVSSTVGTYAVPPAANQKVGPVPLADCLNVTACAKTVSGTPDKYKESERPLDALDSRMQQVSYTGGRLYGSHGTALDPAGDTVQRAGVAWYVSAPVTASNGNLSTSVVRQGRIGTVGQNLLDPAFGVRPGGSAVIGATLAGTDHYPSAAYVPMTSGGTAGAITVLAEGVGPEDGFSGYRIFGDRPRWGDYGAAAVDASGNVWLGAEWIGQRCTFAEYSADPFGQCGGTRTALANWSTRISKV